MEAMRVQKLVERDGEIFLTGLPYKKGQYVEMIILNHAEGKTERPRLTARQLLGSGLVGLWKDRDDIEDNAGYARQLRDKAQNRRG